MVYGINTLMSFGGVQTHLIYVEGFIRLKPRICLDEIKNYGFVQMLG